MNGNSMRFVISLVFLSHCFLSCEDVTVFGDTEKEVQTDEQQITVGACTTDEDCPQWTCVSSSCLNGECVPYRQSSPRLSMEAVSLDEQIVSVSVYGDQMAALTGEPNQDRSGPNSLGFGTRILTWSLDEPYPDGDDEMAFKAYESANWKAESSWSPNLERIIKMASLDPDEPLIETREPLEIRALTLHEDKLWIHAGSELKDLWWGKVGQNPSQGRYFRLAAPAQALVVDQDEAWVSVFDKGIERLSLIDQLESPDSLNPEPNARFNTPGRALFSRAGRSFVVVADAYAGLSLFLKRAQSSLDQSNAARRLVTPPQELSSQGRTTHLDLIADRVISAEFGAGLRITQINTEGGLSRQAQFELGAPVRWVKWVDPYTALAWVDGRGVLALDLLNLDPLPNTIAEINTREIAGELSQALAWSAHDRRFALVTGEGTLYQGKLSCMLD